MADDDPKPAGADSVAGGSVAAAAAAGVVAAAAAAAEHADGERGADVVSTGAAAGPPVAKSDALVSDLLCWRGGARKSGFADCTSYVTLSRD